jgi:hypothetical protein
MPTRRAYDCSLDSRRIVIFFVFVSLRGKVLFLEQYKCGYTRESTSVHRGKKREVRDSSRFIPIKWKPKGPDASHWDPFLL